jgi:DNA repair exonuclease SbcCD ATPase subunit
MTINSLRTALERKKGRLSQIEHTIAETKTNLTEAKRSLHRHEQAREIIREVGLATQQQLQFHITDITSLALEAVFDDPYALVTEFIDRRNKTECDLYFERDGDLVDPLTASGGGAVDVAAFALRVASWSMQNPKSNNVLILDEPFRYLSVNLLSKASEMLKQISKELDLQIIMVTHSPELVEAADTVFEVTLKNKVSSVRLVN